MPSWFLALIRPKMECSRGTGQITTFNQLGFRGCNDKPDGWYLPDDASKPAIILETKSEAEGVSKEKHVKELFKNIDVVAKKYSKTIGILYSSSAIRVFRNKIELSDASKRLENKDYYIRLCTSQKLDSNYIFEITQKINNSLHFKFGMTDLQDRMIFTACALVAQRYNPQSGLQKLKDMDYSTFHNWIYSALSKALEEDKKQNNKLDVLLEEYASVRMSIVRSVAMSTQLPSIIEHRVEQSARFAQKRQKGNEKSKLFWMNLVFHISSRKVSRI